MPCCSHLLLFSDECSQKWTIFVSIGAPDWVQGGELSELMAQPPWGVTLVRYPATLVTALQSAMWSATRGKEALIVTILPTLKRRSAYITTIYAIKLWCCDGQPSCLPWTDRSSAKQQIWQPIYTNNETSQYQSRVPVSHRYRPLGILINGVLRQTDRPPSPFRCGSLHATTQSALADKLAEEEIQWTRNGLEDCASMERRSLRRTALSYHRLFRRSWICRVSWSVRLIRRLAW